MHVICDNSSTHKTPEIQRWLKRHPRFTLHYTPTSARGSTRSSAGSPSSPPRSSAAPPTAASRTRRDINNWVDHWNDNPRPFVWRKTADEILDNLAAYLQRINDSGH